MAGPTARRTPFAVEPVLAEWPGKAAVAKVKDGCKKHVDDEEKIFVQLVEDRLKTRQALLDKAKAKF